LTTQRLYGILLAMKVIIETEGRERKALLIEDDGTPDGGRIIGRIERHDEALAICKAMNWQITDDAFLLRGAKQQGN